MAFLFSRLARRAAAARPSAGARLAPAEAKTSRTGPLVVMHQAGRPVWPSRLPGAVAREAYRSNPVVHRAVRMIAEAAASVPLNAFDGEREVPGHVALALLETPNPRDGAADFLETLYGHLVLAGNAYAEAVLVDGRPRELYALRPDRMSVVPGPDGWPEAWDYGVGGQSVRFLAREEGVQPILHLALFNPLDDHYGLSPADAAANAVDVHDAASAWNKALLDNSARPSGALVYESRHGLPLGSEQFERLKAELEESFQGAINAGRPLLLEGGLDWKPLSLTPKDMDFIAAKASAAREIALAFGVPPMLLGLPGDNTFANYAEANRSFWRQTVLPLVGRTAQALARWLAPDEPGLRLVPDLDRIDALADEREALWRRVGSAGFLTDDEKRAAVGYGAQGAGKGWRAGRMRGLAGDPSGTGGGQAERRGQAPLGKGNWAGPDPVPGDVVAGGGGFATPGTFADDAGDGHWANQPRVPAGNPDGGQWTSEGGGGASSIQAPPSDLAQPAAPRPDAAAATGWTTLQSVEAGGVTGELIKGADGTLIRRETDPGAEYGWTERHVVTLPGSDPVQFLTMGDTQVVASIDGQQISRTSWTAEGPQALPMVQPAFAPAVPLASLAVDAAVALLGWMSLRDSADQRAIASFRAFESDASGLVPEGVVRVDHDTVEQACPRLGEVQNRLDEAVDRVRKSQPNLSASQYGTAVHLDLANQIRNLKDPNFTAEESYFKTSKNFARYGSRGSVRVDVFENVSRSTVCVYDVKTGDEVIRPGRAREIAQAVKMKLGTATRVILTEIKPGL